VFNEIEYPRPQLCSGGIFKAIFGGGSSQPSAPKQAPAQAPATNAAGGAVTPGTSPTDYKKQQEAYYQQMLSGLGMGSPGGALPTGIQDNISKQASLLT
jgi:hypothetical protein